jgi:resolvase-like protein
MPSTNGHGPKQAILYARVSTDEQARSGYSLAQQLEALREYVARECYEVLEKVQDPGQSGASLERPGMDRVRDLVAAGGAGSGEVKGILGASVRRLGAHEEAPESSLAPSRHPYAAGGAQEATEAPEEEPRRGFFSRLFGG